MMRVVSDDILILQNGQGIFFLIIETISTPESSIYRKLTLAVFFNKIREQGIRFFIFFALKRDKALS